MVIVQCTVVMMTMMIVGNIQPLFEVEFLSLNGEFAKLCLELLYPFTFNLTWYLFAGLVWKKCSTLTV